MISLSYLIDFIQKFTHLLQEGLKFPPLLKWKPPVMCDFARFHLKYKGKSKSRKKANLLRKFFSYWVHTLLKSKASSFTYSINHKA